MNAAYSRGATWAIAISFTVITTILLIVAAWSLSGCSAPILRDPMLVLDRDSTGRCTSYIEADGARWTILRTDSAHCEPLGIGAHVPIRLGSVETMLQDILGIKSDTVTVPNPTTTHDPR